MVPNAALGGLKHSAMLVLASALALLGCGKSPPSMSLDPGGSFQEGIASWYGHPFHGKRTANGEVYDMEASTAAHKTLPFDTWVKVVNQTNGRSTTVRINDRGPFVKKRVIDLSRSAAREIAMIGPGTARVKLYILKRPPASKAGDGPFYAVQVGSFRERGNADRLRRILDSDYGDVVVQETRRQGTPFYRVRVGRLPAFSEARRLAKRLQSEKEVEAAFVVRLE